MKLHPKTIYAAKTVMRRLGVPVYQYIHRPAYELLMQSHGREVRAVANAATPREIYLSTMYDIFGQDLVDETIKRVGGWDEFIRLGDLIDEEGIIDGVPGWSDPDEALAFFTLHRMRMIKFIKWLANNLGYQDVYYLMAGYPTLVLDGWSEEEMGIAIFTKAPGRDYDRVRIAIAWIFLQELVDQWKKLSP